MGRRPEKQRHLGDTGEEGAWGDRCDTLGSFPPLLRPPPTNRYSSTHVVLMSWLQRTGLGIFSKTPSRCPSITLVTAVRRSGKGPLCLPRSLGTCFLPAVPPLAWVYVVVWVHSAPRVTERGKDSGRRVAQALLPLPGVEAASGGRVSPSSERVPLSTAETLPKGHSPLQAPRRPWPW